MQCEVDVLASASLSKRANSSLSVFTSSGAGHVEEIAVKPTMSAKRMLMNMKKKERRAQV